MYVILDPQGQGYIPGGYPMLLPPGVLAAANLSCDIAIKERDFAPAGAGDRLVSVPLEELLICVGIATSPAVSFQQPRAWGFLLEHAETFANHSGRLRVDASVADWDTHQKGAFSDRVGMGAAAWALWRHYDVVHVADAGAFIGAAVAAAEPAYAGKWLKSLGKYGKDGKYKPDYFCLDDAGKAVIAEAKGALGPPSAATADRKKGKEQVSNVKPVGVKLRKDANRLVFAVTLRHTGEIGARSAADSTLTVVDPPDDDEALAVDVTASQLIRAAYAKVLSFAGHGLLASALIRSTGPVLRTSFVRSAVVRRGEHEVFPLMMWPNFTFGLDAKVALAVLSGESKALAEWSPESIRPELARWQGGFRLPNGVIANFGP